MGDWLKLKNLLMLCVCIGAVLAEPFNQTTCCTDANEADYDAFYDLTRRSYRHAPGVSIYKNFISRGKGCTMGGVLKLQMPSETSAGGSTEGMKMLIDLFMDTEPRGWVYNLGDSSTNDGDGGDAGTQSRDAELQLYGTITGYYSDEKQNSIAFGMASSTKLRTTLLVSNECTAWTHDCDVTTLNYHCSHAWFSLDSKPDKEGPVNNDLYLGINRVIGRADLIGKGVCKVGIKFIPSNVLPPNTYNEPAVSETITK